jgi:hypothetical protein
MPGEPLLGVKQRLEIQKIFHQLIHLKIRQISNALGEFFAR